MYQLIQPKAEHGLGELVETGVSLSGSEVTVSTQPEAGR